MRRVEVTDYDPRWPLLFEQEAELLRGILGENLRDIHHIGSTAVPGFTAKPIIDIMPVVENLSEADSLEEEFRRNGYYAHGESGIPDRLFYTKNVKGVRKFHLHIVETGSPHIIRHLAVRDYLREHPGARREYKGLKQSLAWEYPYNIKAYIEGKHEYVTGLECRALRWYRKRQS
jgi:GrpB-like predicted nucleotidyltransferase (UPF0157 family)